MKRHVTETVRGPSWIRPSSSKKTFHIWAIFCLANAGFFTFSSKTRSMVLSWNPIGTFRGRKIS